MLEQLQTVKFGSKYENDFVVRCTTYPRFQTKNSRASKIKILKYQRWTTKFNFKLNNQTSFLYWFVVFNLGYHSIVLVLSNFCVLNFKKIVSRISHNSSHTFLAELSNASKYLFQNQRIFDSRTQLYLIWKVEPPDDQRWTQTSKFEVRIRFCQNLTQNLAIS